MFCCTVAQSSTTGTTRWEPGTGTRVADPDQAFIVGSDPVPDPSKIFIYQRQKQRGGNKEPDRNRNQGCGSGSSFLRGRIRYRIHIKSLFINDRSDPDQVRSDHGTYIRWNFINRCAHKVQSLLFDLLKALD